MDRTLIDHAAKCLEPEGVYLWTTDVRRREGFTPPFIDNQLSLIPQYRGGPKDFSQRFTATDEDSGENQAFVHFYFTAGVRLVDGSALKAAEADDLLSEDAVYVEIESEFCARYCIGDTDEQDAIEQALQEFARYNVGYHVWPYWREYVQSTCGRLGIPPIPIPMYRIPSADFDAEV